jgi:flagella basal body P-ring formation protein FlgA
VVIVGKIVLALLPALAAVPLPPVDVSATAVVKVEQQTSVKGDSFTLGEISEVESSDSALARDLMNLKIAISPMPGSYRELEKQVIVSQLLSNGFSLSRVRLICPETVLIYRASQTVGQELLEARLREFIEVNSPWLPGELEISDVSYISDIPLPAGELNLVIRPKGSAAYIGPTPFTVELFVDGKPAKSLVLQAMIKVYREVVVAAAPVPVRQLIGESDVELRRIDISGARGKTFADIKDVVGKTAVTYITPGQVITSGCIQEPILVRRGDAVQLVARRPGFIIRTSGIAQSDGRRGQLIQVLNTASRMKIEAEVTGPQQAEVIF